MRKGARIKDYGNRTDFVAMQRAVSGDRRITPTLTTIEFDMAVACLSEYGYTNLEIAARLGVSDRTIYRSRARMRSLIPNRCPCGKPCEYNQAVDALNAKSQPNRRSNRGLVQGR